MLTKEHAGVVDERAWLGSECLLLIQKKDFNGGDFVEFVSRMSRLAEISSGQADPCLVDTPHNVIVKFKVKDNAAEIIVEPAFFLLPDSILFTVLDGLKEPVVSERLNWSARSPDFVPEITRQLYFPKNYERSNEFQSYVAHRTYTRRVDYEPLFERQVTTKGYVQALCAKVYEAYLLYA